MSSKRGVQVATVLAMFILALSFRVAAAEEKAAKAAAPKAEYVGADKCKMCHNSPKKGAQYKQWSESRHAQAMKTLSGDAAKKIAKEKGIEDPATDAGCVKCHQVGKDEGIGCEACHGPGSLYKNMKLMKDRAKAQEAGLLIPDEKTCLKCHNAEGPTFKGFNFDEYFKKVAHPYPAKK